MNHKEALGFKPKKQPAFVRRLFLPCETFHFLCLFTGVDTLEQNKCLKGI
ncbi:hypothetical protein GYO_3069 [Bacillus spizizenii TU-B-10]|uniref:Uncharacterized protein n=1 Tax=Bacillus spizizenii (strain DSM 15029 / JCM 12233 / NBRC 101239 / NRRL B-23049 / TU-B-10) TaxID=1052585 RepID=G4NYP5_BACS4|nr:hypothetical protein GYO_3069 [Bacillus spizizenii TU-B-10]SCV43023.1 hypothetical protein BQ1740_3333 [Bacillus subtilis]